MLIEEFSNYNINVSNCFNKAARTYDDNCSLQLEIGNKLIDILKKYESNFNFNSIIDLGCGTGEVTKNLIVNDINYKKFYAIDIADELLEIARKKLKNYNINFAHLNFDHIVNLGESFDIIFSNMALQWSENLKETFGHIYKNLNKNGVFAFTIVLEDTFIELESNSKLRFYSFNHIQKLLESKFKLKYASNYFKELEFNSMLEALKSIKYVGANYYGSEQTNSHLRKLLNSRKKQEVFNLTYNIGIFIAYKNEI